MKDFDELLNEALKQEVEAEPLEGLEQRVLNLVRQRQREHTHWRFGWGISVATLAIAVLTPVLIRHSAHKEHPRLTQAPAIVPLREAPVQMAALPREKIKHEHPQATLWRITSSVKMRNARREQREESLPKLETFPAITQYGGGREDGWEAIARSPEAIKALADLKEQQKKSIDIAAIEIKPL